MRKIILTAAAVLASAGFTMAAAEKPPKPETKPAKTEAKPEKTAEPPAASAPAATPENFSYAIGTMIANNLKQQNVKADVAELTRGISDVLEGRKPRLDAAQCQQIMVAFQKQQGKSQSSGAEKAQKERTAQAKASYEKAVTANDKNAIAGRDFLATNGKREGVVTTASGLQYEIMKAGTGAKPTAADTVKVHYHGTLPDGTVFDSSVERNEPISFPLLDVIAGWTEGVQLMPTGSKYKFFIPSYLAYGDRGSPPKIPGHSALIFEVELLAIE